MESHTSCNYSRQIMSLCDQKSDNATLQLYISSLKDKSNSFKLWLVTPTEVSKCIKTLRNGLFHSYDNIPVSFIKPVAEYLESPLTFIINNFIVTSTFPGIWKIARISPIPKIVNPSHLKITDQYQFHQYFLRSMRNQYYNKWQNSLKNGLFTTNINQDTEKTTQQLHF